MPSQKTPNWISLVGVRLKPNLNNRSKTSHTPKKSSSLLGQDVSNLKNLSSKDIFIVGYYDAYKNWNIQNIPTLPSVCDCITIDKIIITWSKDYTGWNSDEIWGTTYYS